LNPFSEPVGVDGESIGLSEFMVDNGLGEKCQRKCVVIGSVPCFLLSLSTHAIRSPPPTVYTLLEMDEVEGMR
jgi:hypothetical protein